MKIAISASGGVFDSPVDPRFGRCPVIVYVDSDTMELTARTNENASAAGGAGIQTAQAVVDAGAQVLLTGNCGPNAHQTLSAAGVTVVTGVSGSVRDAVVAYKSGYLKSADRPNVADHFGTRGEGGVGRGRGIGRGMARGRGGGR